MNELMNYWCGHKCTDVVVYRHATNSWWWPSISVLWLAHYVRTTRIVCFCYLNQRCGLEVAILNFQREKNHVVMALQNLLADCNHNWEAFPTLKHTQTAPFVSSLWGYIPCLAQAWLQLNSAVGFCIQPGIIRRRELPSTTWTLTSYIF